MITFERDGKTHEARVCEAAVPVSDALTVEFEGTSYAISVDFTNGDFVARPVLTEPAEYPLRSLQTSSLISRQR